MTFNGAAMASYLDMFCTQFCKIKVPTEFPRKTRWVDPKGMKASEWRTVALAGFVVFASVFGDTSVRDRRIARLRYFWLLQVILVHLCIIFSLDYDYRGSPFELMFCPRRNLNSSVTMRKSI